MSEQSGLLHAYSKARQLLHLSSYFLWRFVWFILYKLNNHRAPSDPNAVRRHAILARNKVNGFAYNQGHNLLMWYTGELDPEELIRPDTTWNIYSLDDELVYFVRLPKNQNEYWTETCPFTWMEQMPNAIEAAVMTHDGFCNLFLRLPARHEQIIFFTSCARSGTTLLSRLLCIPGKMKSFSEPDILSVLANLTESEILPEWKLAKLTDASLRALTHTIPPNEYVCYKAKPNVTIHMVSMMKKYLPKVRHLFMYRSNVKAAVISNEKVLRYGSKRAVWEEDVGTVLMKLWNAAEKGYLSEKRIVPVFHKDFYRQLHPSSHIELAWIWYGGTYGLYLARKQHFTYTVVFEDMMKDPAGEMKRFFKAFDIPIEDKFVDELCADSRRMKSDSQENTSLSRAAFKGLVTTQMTPELADLSKHYAQVMGLPTDYFIAD